MPRARLGVETQSTLSLYESNVNRSWVTNVIYPDSSDTTSSGTDQVKYSYDPLGRLTQMIDQRGVIHLYDYNSKGQFVKDRITNSISGVDLAVRSIRLAY